MISPKKRKYNLVKQTFMADLALYYTGVPNKVANECI